MRQEEDSAGPSTLIDSTLASEKSELQKGGESNFGPNSRSFSAGIPQSVSGSGRWNLLQQPATIVFDFEAVIERAQLAWPELDVDGANARAASPLPQLLV